MVKYQQLLDGAEEAIQALTTFHDESKMKWSKTSNRLIGHIAYSPPLAFGAGTEAFTEDWSVIELDGSRFKDATKGNVIDLGVF